MRKDILKAVLAISILLLAAGSRVLAQFEEGSYDGQASKLVCTSTGALGTLTYAAASGEDHRTIRNIIKLEIDESAETSGNKLYFKSAFAATVTVEVKMWTLASGSGTPDYDETKTLIVTYDPAPGVKDTVVDYILLASGASAYEKSQATITGVTISRRSGSWSDDDVKALVTVENDMDILHYLTLSNNPTLLAPSSISGTYDGTNHSDQLSVAWQFSSTTNTNISQLEYAWVENETAGFYTVGGTLNYDLLFHDNSTRIDVDPDGNNYTYDYNVPLLYPADPTLGGVLYYRVRAVDKKNDGSLIVGPWSTVQSYSSSTGHEPSLNWQSATSFAENGKSKSIIQYFDGTLRARQTVTKDNSTGNTTVAETIYDLQGRPNVQILPTPTLSTAIQYFSDFNRFVGQTTNDDPAKYFDLSLPGGQCQAAPQLDTTRGNGKYYSTNNPWIGTESTANFVPDANGYAFTETRYTDDPTERVSVQGGAGKAHQIGNGHETKYFYGKPTQNELDALFGTEAGDATHYFKNMVQDANGQMSVSYVDMHGRTIATALAGAAPANLKNINNNTAFYPVSSGPLTNNLLTPANNIVLGDSIEAISSVLVPAATVYNFSYQLTPAIFKQTDCQNDSICFDCKYDLEISIRQEDCSGAAPLVKHFSNLQIVPANEACGTPMGFIGDGISVPTTEIDFSETLGVGSWVVRKTLTINDSLFKIREDSALKVFLCRTQQSIADSVFAALSATTGCDTPAATHNCTSCLANLGSYSTYKSKFIASLGDTTTMTDSAIHVQYTQDSLACAVACGTAVNPAMTTLAVLRAEMLGDMIPYTGQYALPSVSSSALEAKYNIFASTYTGSYGSFGTKPFFRNPVSEPSGAAASYLGDDGLADNTIYPGGNGSDHSLLNAITNDDFTNIFNRNWAAQLIWYHPEYSKLHFAETTLQTSFAWLDNVLHCDTYAQASSNGYLTPLTSDPYFTFSSNTGYVPSDRTNMSNYLTVNVNPHSSIVYSMWQLANGAALCDSTRPLVVRQACIAGMSSSGLDASAVTTAQKDAVWLAFRGLYLGARNEMVMAYINAQESSSLSSSAMTELQTEGKQLRFANAQSLAGQNGWTWWSSATDSVSVDSAALASSVNSTISGMVTDQCMAQRPFWQGRLMQCDVLQQFLLNMDHTDSLKVDTIINEILDSMVMVCHNSINANNPEGASNVNPAILPVPYPANFDTIVNNVFKHYGIYTLPGNHYFCNPWSIDYPKPFNSNPPLNYVYKASADTCNCRQFEALKSTAHGAGVDTTSRSAMNSWLLSNYGDTLSLALWNGLLTCNGHSWTYDTCYDIGEELDSCVSFYQNISIGALVEIPSFLNCGYVQPCVSCSLLHLYTDTFRLLYPAYSGVPYTSGSLSVDTAMAHQNALWARYLNYKTGFSKTSDEYGAAYLNCGYGAGATVLVLSDRSAQPPSGASTPYLYSASDTITFAPGFLSLPGDIWQTQITSYASSSSNALCALDPPVAYMPYPDTSNPCQSVQDQANFIAAQLFEKLKDSLIARFDSLYRAKCLGAQHSEVFYATYTPSEYHFTLYYYDQAGNLVKTLPPAAVQPNYDATYLATVQTDRASATDLSNGTNIENMATQYRYNTLNQVIAQRTPDAGTSLFWYDRLGRLAVSQNAKQAGDPSYSYTLYDALGRITEVGQKPQTTAMTQTISQDETSLASWLADLSTGGTKVQITRTVYDLPYPSFSGTAPITGLNLRNRVSYMQAIDADNTSVPPYRTATFYSYDVLGNVDSLLQDYGTSGVMASANRFKLITYDYDLVSGKVNQVSYQPGKADGFYHQYSYDAENRLTGVRTSTDSILWQDDAVYAYYRHGPLARAQLGDLGVQGLDYAYTVQGWLKAINPSWTDGGSGDRFDGDGNTTVASMERDAYKLTLNYFDDGTHLDYLASAPPSGFVYNNGLPSANRTNLYNGNIGSQAVSIRKLATGSAYSGPLVYNYGYDQLNRITSMDAWAADGNFIATQTGPMGDYAERYGYDPNGNILTLNRHGTTGTGLAQAMDSLRYQYVYVKSAGAGLGEYVPGAAPTSGVDHLTNQLSSIRDDVSSTGYDDIQNQSAANYGYDAIGNLTSDVQSGITSITWSVYGKILSITNGSGTIYYTYDAAGNRISKLAGGITTWYVRDATGNVMAVYSEGNSSLNSGALSKTEAHVYGSSRLGMLNLGVNCTDLTAPAEGMLIRGSKLFELANHLGNVLATVSDKKIQHTTDNSIVDYYSADVIGANDYYPFGMGMPGRSYNNGGYRYGFNGQEKSDEIKGAGNSYTAEFWEYDPRIGRRWNIDPVGKEWESPYAVFSNNPIARVDPNGDSDTASAFKAGIYQSVMDESQKKMQALEPVIKKYEEGIKTMKGLLNQKVLLDVGMSWNIFSWLPQTGSDAVAGSDVDYMASQIAARVGELQDLVQQYNSAYTDYSNAAKSLKLEFQNATHFNMGGIILDRLDGAKSAGMVASATHLNTGTAKSSYALYEIVVDGQTLKYGIADAGRIRKTGQWAGYPERLAQQLSKISRYAPDLEVTAKIHTVLQTTKAEMIVVESAKIEAHAKQLGIPLGNVSHIKKWAELYGKGELSAKAVEALSKFLKL